MIAKQKSKTSFEIFILSIILKKKCTNMTNVNKTRKLLEKTFLYFKIKRESHYFLLDDMDTLIIDNLQNMKSFMTYLLIMYDTLITIT